MKIGGGARLGADGRRDDRVGGGDAISGGYQAGAKRQPPTRRNRRVTRRAGEMSQS